MINDNSFSSINYEEKKNNLHYEKLINEIQKPTIEEIIFYPLAEEERYIVECLVAGESKGESLEGQMAVAQCILNATIRSEIPISEVKSEYGYQGWDSNSQNYPSVSQAVSEVFDKGNFVTEEFIIWFYNTGVGHSSFHESQNFVIEIGGHRFFAPW